jgi:rhomboid family GlyGly-CTERM serine protease
MQDSWGRFWHTALHVAPYKTKNKITLMTSRCITHYWIAAVFSTLLLLLQLFQDELIFHRHLIEQGEIWRLWTGNLIHTNLWHLALNIGGLWLLIFIDPLPTSPRTLLAHILFIGTCTGLGLWFFSPEVVWYAGFSGVLYGLFLLVGIHFAQRKEWASAALILFGICGKTAWDGWHGGNSLSAQLIDAPVIYAAHIYGMTGGGTLALFHWLKPSETP